MKDQKESKETYTQPRLHDFGSVRDTTGYLGMTFLTDAGFCGSMDWNDNTGMTGCTGP